MKYFLILVFVFVSLTNAQNSKETPNQIYQLKTQIEIQDDANYTKLMPDQTGRKKAGIAVLYSLLLPGMGELYAGSYESGKYFTIADGVFWGAVIGFNVYGNWQKDNYESFAASKGGVDGEGKPDVYYADISNYASIESFNRVQELNRDFNKTYDIETEYWKWESNSDRKEFRSMWSNSENAFNSVRFAVGALILNRIVSAINAVRLVSRHNKNLNKELSWNVSFNVEQKPTLPSTLRFNFATTF